MSDSPLSSFCGNFSLNFSHISDAHCGYTLLNPSFFRHPPCLYKKDMTFKVGFTDGAIVAQSTTLKRRTNDPQTPHITKPFCKDGPFIGEKN